MPMNRRLNILAIDDDETDLALLQDMLEELDTLDFELATHTTAANGRRHLATQPTDLVFLDYRLGADDGLEVLRAIRQAGSTCPVIFLTGKGNEAIAAESRRAGSDDYLVKSELTPSRLGTSISYVLEEHAAEQEQQAFEDMLTRLATEDTVTGLLNRRSFMERFNGEIKRTERYGRPLCLMSIDLDKFAGVNEAYGRLAGDQLLATIAVILRGGLRTTDHFCRYRGDQFLVALTETGLDLGRGAAERVHRYVGETAFETTEGEQASLTATVALVVVHPDQADADRALIDALAAVGRGKAKGGDCVVLIDRGEEVPL